MVHWKALLYDLFPQTRKGLFSRRSGKVHPANVKKWREKRYHVVTLAVRVTSKRGEKSLSIFSAAGRVFLRSREDLRRVGERFAGNLALLSFVVALYRPLYRLRCSGPLYRLRCSGPQGE